MGITCSKNELFAYSFFCLSWELICMGTRGKKFYTPLSCLARKSFAGMAEGPKSTRADV